MRDYYVLYIVQDLQDPNVPEVWHADNPGEVASPIPGNDAAQPRKVYVRLPTQQMLVDWFNASNNNANFVQWQNFRREMSDIWGQLFCPGANVKGGYSRLDLVGTADSYGALYGRPARNADGTFRGNR